MCILFVLFLNSVFLWKGRISPKFGVQFKLWNVDSLEVGDTFFTPEHVTAVECGILEAGHIPLKMYKTHKIFLCTFGTLRKTAQDVQLTDLK